MCFRYRFQFPAARLTFEKLTSGRGRWPCGPAVLPRDIFVHPEVPMVSDKILHVLIQMVYEAAVDRFFCQSMRWELSMSSSTTLASRSTTI